MDSKKTLSHLHSKRIGMYAATKALNEGGERELLLQVKMIDRQISLLEDESTERQTKESKANPDG